VARIVPPGSADRHAHHIDRNRTRHGLGCARRGSSRSSTAAAHEKIDSSTLADPVSGPIFADLPAGTYLSLGQVVKLHDTDPELFAWCR
jgi:hypothetical protein